MCEAPGFGELSPGKWMAGSDTFQRTQQDQAAYPSETADSNTLVQMVVVYRGRNIAVYRDGKPYAAYEIKQPQVFGSGSVVMFRKRHLDMGEKGYFRGKITDARVYDRPLTATQIAALEPGALTETELKPWAWWSFAGGSLREQTGRFDEVKVVGDVSVIDGALVLGKGGATVIASSTSRAARIATPSGWAADQPVPGAVIPEP